MLKVGSLVRIISSGQQGIVASMRTVNYESARLVVQVEGTVVACLSSDVEEISPDATNTLENGIE